MRKKSVSQDRKNNRSRPAIGKPVSSVSAAALPQRSRHPRASEEQTGGGETHQKPTSPEAFLSTNQGLPISDNQNSLKAGKRGPTLLEDFILREKITHFDHERIPERIVHARGVGAHGYFQPYKSLKHAKWCCSSGKVCRRTSASASSTLRTKMFRYGGHRCPRMFTA
jgi:catalase